VARGGPARRRLLYAGQLADRKGIRPFLAALREWAAANPQQQIELWIAGHGALQPWLAAFEAPPNLAMTLLGHVPFDELPAVYAQCGILVFPTLADEWGLVVNEAMASGLPVLGSRYSQAVEELVEDGVNGWVFDPDDPAATQRALDSVFETSNSRLDQMRLAARRRVETLTPEGAAEQIAKVIERVSEPGVAGS
jgi:glycosyltransferase involved in cell wall biosynthesis